MEIVTGLESRSKISHQDHRAYVTLPFSKKSFFTLEVSMKNRRIHLSVSRYRLFKNGLVGLTSVRTFEKRAISDRLLAPAGFCPGTWCTQPRSQGLFPSLRSKRRGPGNEVAGVPVHKGITIVLSLVSCCVLFGLLNRLLWTGPRGQNPQQD